MIFEQYVNNEITNAMSATVIPMLKTKTDCQDIDDILSNANPSIMTGRICNAEKYCFYKNKYINLTELDRQIKALYAGKGILGRGFSKLTAEDFVSYSTSKVVLLKLFDLELYDKEIDCKAAASYFAAADYAGMTI